MVENNKDKIIPLVASRGAVAFPKGIINIDVARQKSIAAIQDAIKGDKKIFIVAQSYIDAQSPVESDLYNVGTVCEIRQFQKYAEGDFRLTALGKYKAKIIECYSDEVMFSAKIKRIPERSTFKESDKEITAIIRAIKKKFAQYGFAVRNINRDYMLLVEKETDPFTLFTTIACMMPFNYQLKQEMLEESNLFKKLELLLSVLTQEAEIAVMERKMIEKVERRIDQNQRDYFLREQVKVIQEELNENASLDNNNEGEYIEKILEIKNMPEDSREKLITEAKRLERMPESSHESYVITNYLDTVLNLPWDEKTDEYIDLDIAEKMLDSDHYGLKKVKERILENLAVRSFNSKIKGQILCLVGPPGVGKTSIGHSIANAIGRKFVRISLGGVNDESDIRGHRKTYIGAMPGRIINGMIKAKVKNPLVLLDEIDKMGSSFKGDPSAAMLEVLDGEQNNTFTDHYIDVPFDLSECFFITTANSTSSIPAPLLDRMEVIELSSYTLEEKFHIAKEYLIEKQLDQNGLSSKKIKITDEAIYEIIEGYTREAGVRKLERTIASLLRKAAKKLLSGKSKMIKFNEKNISNYLGSRKYIAEKIGDNDEIGLVNGLAWTSVGGELMQIEAGIMDGKGTLQLTGNLGDVMKESANTALSYVRSVASKYNIPNDFYKNKDIHIHVPEGAVPKDGPSAGVAIATVLVSALSNTPIRHDIAMTGEISLRGRDLAIGGLKEKAIAAFKSGVTTVLIPQDNMRDLDEIDESVRKAINFIPCKTADQVLDYALIKRKTSKIRENKAIASVNKRAKVDSEQQEWS
ncbi:MAG: endopeptidase La [Oscillospiraceae bacterium]|nr:endopeptidase La [Oscillospiraceae bacterium]